MSDAGDNSEIAREGPRLNQDRGHIERCHRRWLKDMTRPNLGGDKYPDEWYAQQCGGCRFYIQLTGGFHSDWGVCTNVMSPRDGRATFEHDGCDQFMACETGWS